MNKEDQFIKVYGKSLDTISSTVYNKVYSYTTKKYINTELDILKTMINTIYVNAMMCIDPESESYDSKYYDSLDSILKNTFCSSMWNELNLLNSKKKIIHNKLKSNSTETCYKCKESNVYIYEKQTRSADEAATIFYRCLTCDNNWRK
jgi:DNA-directed RNA polymerase subunit M/transcription elongation factor TFIIS